MAGYVFPSPVVTRRSVYVASWGAVVGKYNRANGQLIGCTRSNEGINGRGASNAIFFNHGQCCCAGSRLFVQEKRYERVLQGVSEAAGKIRLGPGLDPSTQMGPLVSKVQFERVTGFLKSGREEGARTVAGGERHGNSGYFVQPTVLDGTRENMGVYQEEIFGPVVTVTPFKDVDADLIRRANDTVYGLAAVAGTSATYSTMVPRPPACGTA